MSKTIIVAMTAMIMLLTDLTRITANSIATYNKH